MTDRICPFCELPPGLIIDANEDAVGYRYPLTEGHTLVIPRRHVSVFEASETERANVWALVDRVRADLSRAVRPDAFNIGINDGVAAGQTVEHGHVHMIPRRSGDVADPRGGIRWVNPERARYRIDQS